jgi:hypothetical protein
MRTDVGEFASSRAVLIGVSAFQHAEFPPIRAARNSLQAMRVLLSDPALCGWPPEQITTIANPISAESLAVQVADLAEGTTDVLLLYYVGHGVLSDDGELCLTVPSTHPNRPKISGLHWDTVADMLRACPARTRLVILDCCFAGQAIEALSGSTGSGLADITHVNGVYTMTATTRNRTAHVPAPDQQDNACTSFTAELQDLIRVGIRGGPPRLTLGDIYPVLRQRLLAKGLPAPNQRGTDTAYRFPFAANAAIYVRDGGKPASRTGQTVSEQAGMDHRRAMLLLRDAERIAWSIAYEGAKATALAEIAQAIATSDPERATRLIEDAVGVAQSYTPPAQDWNRETLYIVDPDPKGRFLARVLPGVAKILATWNPDEALRLAESIPRGSRAKVLAAVAYELAACDLEEAERLAESITILPWKAQALAGIAQVLATSDPERAARLIDAAERESANAARSLASHQWDYWEVDEALTTIAAVLATSDPDRAERVVALITDQRSKVSALVGVMQVLATSDPDRAERLAGSITDQRDKAAALAGIAQALAASDPGRAARLIDDAEQVAQSITGQHWQEDQASALAGIAQSLAPSDRDRAERLAGLITDQRHKAAALTGIAQALAASDPDRAERIARSITIPELQVSALVRLARTGLQNSISEFQRKSWEEAKRKAREKAERKAAEEEARRKALEEAIHALVEARALTGNLVHDLGQAPADDLERAFDRARTRFDEVTRYLDRAAGALDGDSLHQSVIPAREAAKELGHALRAIRFRDYVAARDRLIGKADELTGAINAARTAITGHAGNQFTARRGRFMRQASD